MPAAEVVVFEGSVGPCAGVRCRRRFATSSVRGSAATRLGDEGAVCMRAAERMETARLVLRRPTSADAGAIFDGWASDPAVTRYVSWPTHDSPAATAAFLEFSDAEWERWPAGPLLIESRDTGAVMGSTGFGFDTPTMAEVGYVLATRFWGCGYATEALSAIVDLAREMGVVRLHAGCHPLNTASANVLEKCGFVRDRGPSRTIPFPNFWPRPHAEALEYSLELEA